MLVPDCERAVREIARVLRPGARAALAVWAEPDRNDCMTAVGRSARALARMAAAATAAQLDVAERPARSSLLDGSADEMARAGLEPATPRFSAVCSTS